MMSQGGWFVLITVFFLHNKDFFFISGGSLKAMKCGVLSENIDKVNLHIMGTVINK